MITYWWNKNRELYWDFRFECYADTDYADGIRDQLDAQQLGWA